MATYMLDILIVYGHLNLTKIYCSCPRPVPNSVTFCKTRSSATAERQRVSYTRLSRLTHWSCTSLSTTSVLQLYNRLAKLVSTLSRQTVRHAHFKLNPGFKVIQGHPYWCRQESRTVCCRNVPLMPTLFLKLTNMQRENGKFVDFNDPTQVWRRPSKKRLQISTKDLYRQKLRLLAYIFVTDSMGLHSSVFT